MRGVDPKVFGERVAKRRLELGLSQKDLGKLAGYSQQNIGVVESGSVKRPERVVYALAEAMQTTREWLLHGSGPKQAGPEFLTSSKLLEEYDLLDPEDKAAITRAVKEATARRKKRSA